MSHSRDKGKKEKKKPKKNKKKWEDAMKRLAVILLISFLFFSFISPAHALLRKDREYVVGKIVDLLPQEQKVVILDYNSREKKTFIVEKGWQNAVMNAEVVLGVDIETRTVKSIRPINPNAKINRPTK